MCGNRTCDGRFFFFAFIFVRFLVVLDEKYHNFHLLSIAVPWKMKRVCKSLHALCFDLLIHPRKHKR